MVNPRPFLGGGGMLEMRLDRPGSDAVAQALIELAAIFGDRLACSLAVREQHANTTTWVAGEPPDAVVFPRSTEDVQQVVRICARHGMPLIPFGTGTSFEGHVNAPFGGVSVDLKDMNRVLAVHAEDFDCVVEPGITRKQLNDAPARPGPVLPGRSGRGRLARRHGFDPRLGHHGRALRHDEGQRAGAEGRAAQRRADDDVAAGAQVLGRLRPHPADRRRRRHARHHHRTDLEAARHPRGDLGGRLPASLGPGAVATPPSRRSSPASPSPASSCSTRCRCASAMPTRSWPCPSSRRCSSNSTAPRRASPSRRSASARSQRSSALRLRMGHESEDRTRLWQTRHDVFWALRSYRAGAKVVVTDVCVPISRLAECVAETQARHRGERARRADRGPRR